MPSATLTLAQIRALAQQESDMVNSNFISTAEWNSYINQSYFELYDLMVQKYGDDYFVGAPYVFATDGVNDTFALPSDFYKLAGVDLAISNDPASRVTIHRFNFSDRNRYSVPNFQSFYGVTNLRYRLRGNNLWLTPRPSANQSIYLYYVPRMTQLVADGDVADGVSGWLEYVIVDAAIKAKDKEESDVSVLMARKAGLVQRIEAAAENRDQGMPMTVSDNMSNDYSSIDGSGNGSGAF